VACNMSDQRSFLAIPCLDLLQLPFCSSSSPAPFELFWIDRESLRPYSTIAKERYGDHRRSRI